MKKLLEKILGIEKELKEVKISVEKTINDEEVSVTMTKKERKNIKELCDGYYMYARRSYFECHQNDTALLKLIKEIEKF